MIVPMKKYSFLIYHKDYVEFLDGLRDIGVLHVIEKQTGEFEDEKLRINYGYVNQLNAAIKFLKKRDIDQKPKEEGKDGLVILKELQGIDNERESNFQKRAVLKKDILTLEPWGDFSISAIRRLKSHGLAVRFLITSASKFEDEWFNEYNLEVITESGGQKYFIIIQEEGEKIEIDAEEVRLPESSLSELKEQYRDIRQIIKKSDDVLDLYAKKYIPLLEKTRDEIIQTIDYDKVILSTEKQAEDKLMLLEGWVPKDKESVLIDFLNTTGSYYAASAPAEDEKIPIKLKNNRFARLFEPIGKLYMLPDYKELDLTPFFAPFFMMFFGFCLGDAGYGLLILLIGLLIRNRVKSEMKPIINLGIYLSIATIVFGLLSGTFFGINLIDSGYILTQHSIMSLTHSGVPSTVIDQLQPLLGKTFQEKSLFLKELQSHIKDPVYYESFKNLLIKNAESRFAFLQNIRYLMLDTNNMMMLSLVIGYIQIVFGMFIKTANKIKFSGMKHAVSTMGWTFIMLGGGILFLLNKIEMLSPETFRYALIFLLIAGGLPVFLYNSPGKNIFLNIGLGVWDSYNMISGFIGNLLSYIRLFALGLSSAVLGMVFNKLALSLLDMPPVVGHLLFLVLLLIGHSLNLFMAALGSFVHPMRLTFVEFYGTVGFTGGGKEYKPFSKTSKN